MVNLADLRPGVRTVKCVNLKMNLNAAEPREMIGCDLVEAAGTVTVTVTGFKLLAEGNATS